MNKNLLTFFKSAKTLSPRQEFLSVSKQIIINTQQQQPMFAVTRIRLFNSLKFSAALAFASFLLFALLNGSSSFSGGGSTALINSKDQLLGEANLTNFQLQIKEAAYYAQTADQVAVALDEISNSATPLNQLKIIQPVNH
jgi:hypothetical protein